MSDIIKQLQNAKLATREMQNISSEIKKQALQNISKALLDNIEFICKENEKDIVFAKDNGLTNAMIDRLLLNEERIKAIASDVLKVIDLHDPIGEVIREIQRPNGLLIKQVRTPIGVIGVIYESRPNVTVDIATLCLKTNNVCVLKGGKEAIHSNVALVKIMKEAVQNILPKHCIELLETTKREDIDVLIKANDYVDVAIPRGGAGLIQHVVKNATVPVIETGAGVCHLYVDKEADLDKAIAIAVNGKVQRPSVCNALETILVHKDIASFFVPKVKEALDAHNVTIYGDIKTRELIKCEQATDKNYATEYGDYIINCKVVESIAEAIDHIYQFSTKHSESIVSENKETCELFLNALDSACVYANASTRFSDGGEFGFGAEVGISTQKLHARGPLGLQEITSTKYKIYGNGQIR
ncbi:MAG: glutamate-5-semialdehyde dehydrogenase [Coprobacillaceae bacterium]